ncbi:hypothetical protein SS50377_25729 [Spironucleus salmonicida]|uniref:Uncharacterized protein n=1 Tax=Spironucleus salmonicida TaxID=348837 RepID=V6LDX2_9EUKA|nr:hypothetical protein SS50377_25729 [Spironucleus salmonicida]|eukprot:EST42662.1 Hypothetical protein SS50377_17673 [Spironucleus salmonicida]
MFGIAQKTTIQQEVQQPQSKEHHTLYQIEQFYNSFLSKNLLQLQQQQQTIAERISQALYMIELCDLSKAKLKPQPMPDLQSLVDASALNSISEYLEFLKSHGTFQRGTFSAHLAHFQKRLQKLLTVE